MAVGLCQGVCARDAHGELFEQQSPCGPADPPGRANPRATPMTGPLLIVKVGLLGRSSLTEDRAAEPQTRPLSWHLTWPRGTFLCVLRHIPKSSVSLAGGRVWLRYQDASAGADPQPSHTRGPGPQSLQKCLQATILGGHKYLLDTRGHTDVMTRTVGKMKRNFSLL